MNINYQSFTEFPGWSGAPDLLASLIDRYRCTRVLEVGSGANPTLSPELVRQYGLVYTTSDTSASEMEKADPIYTRLVLDLSEKMYASPKGGQTYDCVFSRMVGEHIQDAATFHANIFNLLEPGGISVHCFAALGCLPFLANRFLPEVVSSTLLNVFAPRDRDKHDKFRAYYSWGSGPTQQMITRFTGLGFEVVRYTGYFGHGYYRRRLSVLHKMEMLKTRWLVNHPIAELCSYGVIVLRKPEPAKGSFGNHQPSAHATNDLLAAGPV